MIPQEATYLYVDGVKELPAVVYNQPHIPYELEANVPFDATIEILGYQGKYLRVKDVDTGTIYGFFSSYLIHLIHLDVIRGSQVTGIWQVVKQGMTQSIKLA